MSREQFTRVRAILADIATIVDNAYINYPYDSAPTIGRTLAVQANRLREQAAVLESIDRKDMIRR